MQTYMSVRGNSAANNTVLVDGMVVNASRPMRGAELLHDAMAQK